MVNRYSRPNDNPDLLAERQSCPFDTDDLAAKIHGGIQVLRERHRILKAVEDEPELRDTIQDLSHMTRMEKFENSYKKTVIAEKYMDRIIDRNVTQQYEHFQYLVNGTDGHAMFLKHVIVLPLLENACNEEQRKLFLEPARRHEFASAYAQTEMAHGTDVQKLETTATYDPKTEEFVLNSPNIPSSLKWWPGGLGKAASMAVVMAQLWTKGQCYGMHPFFVQIRDFETHLPLPGVIVGDIGPTFANNTNDNGYLGFKQFRVPRISLLMKHCSVHPDGTYDPPIHPHIAYTGMMFVRASMIFEMGLGLGAAATIASRYSCVRRQGQINGKEEVKILDYQTQQYRILPHLARAMCFCFAGHYSMQLYRKVMEDIKNGDASQMADLHAISSGLKAVCSFQASQGAEQCRLSCGGHGYSLASGLPKIYTTLTAGCTYEGDNLVMLLQLARYLMKCAKEVRSGEQPANEGALVQYLYAKENGRSEFNTGSSKEKQWLEIQKAFEHTSCRITMKTFDRFSGYCRKGDERQIAWNKTSIELAKAARCHTRTFLSRNFIRTVLNEENGQIREVLGDLLQLYLHYELLECRADLLEDGFMSSAQLDQSRNELEKILFVVRRNAVSISDSFDIPDRMLCSQLGRRDGHVYEALFKWAQNSVLNKHEVLPFHHQTLGKLMKERAMSSKL